MIFLKNDRIEWTHLIYLIYFSFLAKLDRLNKLNATGGQSPDHLIKLNKGNKFHNKIN